MIQSVKRESYENFLSPREMSSHLFPIYHVLAYVKIIIFLQQNNCFSSLSPMKECFINIPYTVRFLISWGKKLIFTYKTNIKYLLTAKVPSTHGSHEQDHVSMLRSSEPATVEEISIQILNIITELHVWHCGGPGWGKSSWVCAKGWKSRIAFYSMRLTDKRP